MAVVIYGNDSSGVNKRKRLNLSSERIAYHFQRLRASDNAMPDDAVYNWEHVAFATQDPDSAHAVCCHPEWAEIWSLCVEVCSKQHPARAEALTVALNMLSEPGMKGRVWDMLIQLASSEAGVQFIANYDDVNYLADQSVTAWDSSVLVTPLLRFLVNFFRFAPDSLMVNRLDMFMPASKMNPRLQNVQSAQAPVAQAFVSKMMFSPFDSGIEARLRANSHAMKVWVVILIDGIRDGTLDCPAALGNIMSSGSFRDLLRSDLATTSRMFSHCASALYGASPGHRPNMIAFLVNEACFVDSEGTLAERFYHNPDAADIICSFTKLLEGATSKDPEMAVVLERCASHSSLKRVFLDGGNNLRHALQGVCQLFSGELAASFAGQLGEACIGLLKALFRVAGTTAIVASLQDKWSQMIPALCSTAAGKTLLDCFLPTMQWQPQLVQLLPLEYKREWMSRQICSVKANQFEKGLEVVVYRDSPLNGLCDTLNKPSSKLREGINVQFRGNGENGIGDGHRREFFNLIAKELTDPDFGLFKSQDGGRSVHINSTAADMQPDHVAQFELCGKLIGLAFLHQETLPSMRITPVLRKLLLGNCPIVLEDLALVDPDLYVGKILYLQNSRYKDGDNQMSIEDLALSFVDNQQPDLFPNATCELCPGGADIAVSETNKHHYLLLLCKNRLRGSIRFRPSGLQ